MIAILWMSGDPKGYTDLLPSWWFEEERLWSDLRHDVVGPRRGRSTARCSVIVRGKVAEIDYGGEHRAYNEGKFDPGITRLTFADEARSVVHEIEWRDEGDGNAFERADVQWSEVATVSSSAYDPEDELDGRIKIKQLVALRQGQPQFRHSLLDAYERRCAMTGCTIEEVLEAAHISPFAGVKTNHVTNGLLLRADLHTLFDLGLITIDPDYNIIASPRIKDAYDLPNKITLPADPANHPNGIALKRKLESV